MEIFSTKEDEDDELKKIFDARLKAIEARMFALFLKGYKDGFKNAARAVIGEEYDKNIAVIEALGIKPEQVLNSAYETGRILGILLYHLQRKETYGTVHMEFIYLAIGFFKSMPNFNRNILRKSIKRVDIKQLNQNGLRLYKSVLSEIG